MWLGSREDVTTYAVSLLLDTVFGGNRELYQNVNMFIGIPLFGINLLYEYGGNYD